VDSRRDQTSTAADHQLPEESSQVMTRRLNNGAEFQIVKNFHAPAAVQARCAASGLDVTVRETPTYFQYGIGTRRA
jgi:demethylmenaquinone methyltransferase/2-methoxy-6-polyprenyl-1,4-benzoquinol methylase